MLTEKGTQRIEIIVRKAVEGGQQGAKEIESDQDVTNENKDQEVQEKGGGSKSKKSKAWWRTQITHGLAVAKQGLTQWYRYELAGIGYKTGDESLQAQIGRDVERIEDTVNVATSVAMGATYGASGGPLGMAIGAAMMGTQTALSIHFKYATRERDYKMKIFKENNAIEYKRARAQINLTTGRLR